MSALKGGPVEPCFAMHVRIPVVALRQWLNRLRSKPDVPLRGAPAVRRQKTYSSRSGYVYQYFYLGQRPALRGGEQGIEYVFEVTADRKISFPVPVFLTSQAVKSWNDSHGRILTRTEEYAIAKMALFQAFDERTHPGQMKHEIRVRPADVEGILETLDID